MIEVGNIVTLENGMEYLLLEELNVNSVDYTYAVRVLEDETPTDEFLIFESMKTDDGEYLKVVTEEGALAELTEKFRNKVEEKILDIDTNELKEEVAE